MGNIIWDSEIIDLVVKKFYDGISFLVQSPFYKMDTKVRKSNLLYKYTDEELDELYKIVDIEYFFDKWCEPILRNYFELNTDNYNFVKDEYISLHKSNHRVVVKKSKQMGESFYLAISILHKILTLEDKSVLIVSENRNDVVKILKNVKNMYLELPFYMKRGVVTWNQSSISFDNGVKIESTFNKANTKKHDCYIIRKVSLFNPSIWNKIWKPIQIKLIENEEIALWMSSTMGGDNINDFKEVLDNKDFNMTKGTIHWSLIEDRDDYWAEKMKKYLGDDDLFRQDYDLEK
jgi:glycerol-3-phosphate cytidylyltransferase-like family protein